MAEQPSRKRRIIRRTVMVLAVVALLPVWYVGAWLYWPKVQSGALLGRAPVLTEAGNRFFWPITWYSRTDYPGSDALSQLWWWANPVYRFMYPDGNPPTPTAPLNSNPRAEFRTGDSLVRHPLQ